MATLAMTPEDEERERLERVGQLGRAPGGPALLGGRSSRPGAMGTGGLGPRGGGGFVGLDKYAAANESANQALGNKVVGSVGQAGTEARGALGTAVSDFNRDANAGEVRADQNLLQRLNTNPAAITQNLDDTKRFERMRDAEYSGPLQLSDTASFGTAAQKLGDAERIRQLAGSDRGVSELSDKSVQGPRTTGGRSLDTALLLGDETLRGRLNTASEDLGKLGGEVDTAATAAAERGKQAVATTDKTRADTRGALTQAQGAFREALDANVAQKRLESFYRAVQAQEALRGYNPALGNLPTAGQAGRYYEGNDPTQPNYREGSVAGNVPEFIHNTSGEQAVPGMQQFVGQNLSRAPSMQELADLGLTPQDWAELAPLFPVVPIAASAAAGTNNVNPYAFLEAYGQQIGDLSRFAKIDNPNVTIQRENLASADDYARAAALEQLAGQDLAERILDPAQAAQAGTANLDLVNFDKAAANQARDAAIQALMARAGRHVAGNARSGSGTRFIVAPWDYSNV